MKRLVIGRIIWLPYFFIFAVIFLRLFVDHPYNFIPIFSCLLFFGACRPARECALPVLALVGVDAFLTTHQYGFALSTGHMVTWIWYLFAVTLGAAALGKSISVSRVLGSSLLASGSFFVASNFTVWAEWAMYPRTMAGLNACYVAALPFFRNSIVSETVFSLGIFLLAHFSEPLLQSFRTHRIQI